MNASARRPFRLVDSMVLVAATAVAFAIYRQGLAGGLPFTTFGFFWEPWLFYWMHHLVPFPAIWSLALFAIDAFDRRTPRRRKFRRAGAVASVSSVVVLALTALMASGFYALHILEEYQAIPRIFTHNRGSHGMPPFAGSPMEEFVGAGVLGAWSVMAATGRWRVGRSWIDWTGFALGMIWIALFLIYLYGYTG